MEEPKFNQTRQNPEALLLTILWHREMPHSCFFPSLSLKAFFLMVSQMIGQQRLEWSRQFERKVSCYASFRNISIVKINSYQLLITYCMTDIVLSHVHMVAYSISMTSL